MDPYTYECTPYIYDFGQPCMTLLSSCMRTTYDNYSTIRINETLIDNFFIIILQLVYWIFVQQPNY